MPLVDAARRGSNRARHLTSCARDPARHALVDAALSSVQAGGNNRVAFLSFDALSPAAAPHRRARSEASPSLRVRSGEPTEGRARLLAHDRQKIIEGRAGSVYPPRNDSDNLKLPVASTSDRTNSNRPRM